MKIFAKRSCNSNHQGSHVFHSIPIERGQNQFQLTEESSDQKASIVEFEKRSFNDMTFDPLLKSIFIEGLQKVAHWYQNDKTYYLRSIFDLVGFIDLNGTESKYFVLTFSLTSQFQHLRFNYFEA